MADPHRVDRRALSERLARLAERAGSGRALARAAGLPSEKHVSLLIKRCQDDPAVGVDLRTLEALASGARLPLAELLGLEAGAVAGELPGWAEAEAEARRRYPTIRAGAWEAARRVVLPAPVAADAAFAAGLARLLDDAQPTQ